MSAIDDDPQAFADAQAILAAAAGVLAEMGFSDNRLRRILTDFALAWRPTPEE